MSKRIYPVNDKYEEVDEKLTVNGVAIAADGTIDSSYISGSSGGGAFTDGDGNGVADLDVSHADFAGGEARGIAAISGGVAGNQTISSLVGTNLSVDSNGALNAAGGSGRWTKDGEIRASGATNASYTLSTTYDVVQVVVHEIYGNKSTSVTLNARINGIGTTDYRYIDESGTSSSGVAQWSIVSMWSSGADMVGSLTYTGTWTQRPNVTVDLATGHNVAMTSGDIIGGQASPLDSLKFWWSSGTISMTADVYGMNLP